MLHLRAKSRNRGFAAVLAGVALAAGAFVGAAQAWPAGPYMLPTARPVNGPLFWSIAQTWGGDAPCVQTSPLTVSDRLAPYLTGDGEKVSTEVAGFQLQDQPAEAVAAFAALTADLSKRIRQGKAQPIVSDCHDVACAADALFGPEAGPRLLLLATAYRFEASDLGAEAERAWTPAELDTLLTAFGDLPADWFPLDTKKLRVLLYRNTEANVRMGAPPAGATDLVAIAGEGFPGILVANGWRKLSDVERRATIVHELGHEYARAHHWRGSWSRAMGEDKALARPLNNASSVSYYADESPDEDFAESVAAYRYMPAFLKARAPARYAYLRDRVFGGQEYLAPETCGARFPHAAGTQVADGR